MTTAQNQPVEALVSELIALGGPLTDIVAHMAAAPGKPSSSRIAETLTMLLRGTLEPLRDSFAAEDIATAAAVLRAATDHIVEDILIVPHDR